jgi:hypothetical protein
MLDGGAGRRAWRRCWKARLAAVLVCMLGGVLLGGARVCAGSRCLVAAELADGGLGGRVGGDLACVVGGAFGKSSLSGD